MSQFLHSSGYYFIALSKPQLDEMSAVLYLTASSLNIKGTIILSPEGMNIAIAGLKEAVQQLKIKIATLLHIDQVEYRDTDSAILPFQKLLIKRKKQIIPFQNVDVPLKTKTAPYLSPKTFHQWLKEKRDIVMLDVRNEYEVKAGSFQNKVSLQLNYFKDFSQKTAPLKTIIQSRPLVTFCTGGIRCEKASGALLQQGFENVYQLKGGILNYFAHYGSAYYEGGCFVFDERNLIYPAS